MNDAHPGSGALLKAYVVLVLLFLFAPLGASLVFSFNSDRFPTLPLGSFTLDWYRAVLADELVRESLGHTALVSVLSASLSTVLGFAAAYTDYRHDFLGKRFYLALGLLPPTVPAIILGLAMLAYLSRLGLAGSWVAIVIAHTVICTPFAMALVRLRLSQVDRAMEAAAWNLGATPWAALRHVILPFCAPTLLGAWLLTMAVSFDEFAIAWFVGGLHETLPVRVLGFLQGQVSPRINAIGTLVFAVSIALVAVAQLVLARRLSLRQPRTPAPQPKTLP
jgi:spermidine/putrescine transport system permease protein